MFMRSMRALAVDGFRRSLWGYILVAILLGSWGAWFLRARMAVYEVTETARLESDQAVHPIQSPVTGRVVATHLVVGQEIQAGAVLVELDADTQRLELEEAQARRAAFTAQLNALRKEVAAAEEARYEEGQAVRRALEEARARHHEAEVAARAVEEEAAFFARLQARGLVAQLDSLRSTAEANKRRAAADTLRLAVSRLEGEPRTRERERRVRSNSLGARSPGWRAPWPRPRRRARGWRTPSSSGASGPRSAGASGRWPTSGSGQWSKQGTPSGQWSRRGTSGSWPSSSPPRRSAISAPANRPACGSRAFRGPSMAV